jgi:uncharacterized protein (TIGR03435 family)
MRRRSWLPEKISGINELLPSIVRNASALIWRRLMAGYRIKIVVLALIALVPAVGQSNPSATPIQPMALDAHPAFAVATVKPHDPNDQGNQGINFVGDRIKIENQTIDSMMMYAYSIHREQIVGMPESVGKDSYDITGTIDTPGQPNRHQGQEMLQELLAARFGLKFHREQRPLKVYVIQIAKGGPKLLPAAHPEAQANQHGRQRGTKLCNIMTSAGMGDFVLDMQYFVDDRPLVDQTGLTGQYDFTLCYTPDDAQTADPDAAPGLFTALQEQLGLKFVPATVPVDVFVIDHVTKPSEN